MVTCSLHGRDSLYRFKDIASKFDNLPNVHLCKSMARIFAVAVFLAFTGVQAIRSEDDLHEGTMQYSSGIEKEVAKMVCGLGFKWWPAYPQLSSGREGTPL